MTIKIYFKVFSIWTFKDVRDNTTAVRSGYVDFSIDIYKDVFDSIPNTDYEESRHIFERFHAAFFKSFPYFNIEEYNMIALDSNDRVMNIDPNPYICTEVKQLISLHKNSCTKAEGAIRLRIDQRRRTREPLNAAARKVCRECRTSITGVSFQCVQCVDYNMCSLCVTCGKHPQHAIIRASTDSEVNRDTVAKLLSSSVKLEELEAKVKEQDVKLKEKDAEILSLVTIRSQAVALLSSPSDGSTPQNKRRKTGVSQGPLPENIKVEV